MSKEKNFISAVIYVHDASDRIADFLNTVLNVLDENFEKSEIICVNDNSHDDSAKIIKEISKNAQNTSISILNLSYYHGLEMAMNAGMDLAIGDFVLEFDTTVRDYDKEEIINVYKKSLTGFDIVGASPDKKQRLTSKVFYYLFDRYSKYSYKIYTESFRILSRRAINRIGSLTTQIPYRKAAYANCGLKITNIKYDTVSSLTNDNINKIEHKYRTELAIDSLIQFTEVGFKFSVSMTVIMMLVIVFAAIYSLAVYMVSAPVEGWTTTILFLSFTFFGVFAALTIIIKYLQILVDLTFKKKQYTFESIEKLTK